MNTNEKITHLKDYLSLLIQQPVPDLKRITSVCNKIEINLGLKDQRLKDQTVYCDEMAMCQRCNEKSAYIIKEKTTPEEAHVYREYHCDSCNRGYRVAWD